MIEKETRTHALKKEEMNVDRLVETTRLIYN